MPGCLNNESIVTRKLGGVNHFHYYLCRRLGGGMEIKMWDIDIKDRIYYRLANEIFFRIVHGEYELGTKLPSSIYLAKEAGSSQETLRKAFRELQQHGVIQKTRQGYYVTSSKPAIAAYRQQYLAAVEKEYHTAKEKVEI